MQIKVTLRFYFTPVKMAIINNTTTNAGEGVGEKKHLYTIGENVN
jgi:hypothetical protein